MNVLSLQNEMMDFKKNSFLAHSKDFRREFRIKKFEQLLEFDEIEELVHTGGSEITDTETEFMISTGEIIGVSISICGKGNLREDKGYVTISIDSFGARYHRTLTCSFTASIIDVEGETKLPRNFDCIFPDRNKYFNLQYSERFIERSLILNNASEYLREDTLTVIAEGVFEEWVENDVFTLPYSIPQSYDSTFKIIEKPNLKVYLRKDSFHAKTLIEHSSVFRDMWNTPMLECLEECVLLQNEELLSFLNMLAFLDTKKLTLRQVTVYDLYKIADKYDIPVLLNECRQRIEDSLCDTVSDHLRLLKTYDNKENPESNIKKYYQEIQKNNSNFEVGNSIVHSCFSDQKELVLDHFITTRERFNEYLENLRLRMEEVSKSSLLISYWTREKNAHNFKTEMNYKYMDVYLRKDSEHAQFLTKYSGFFRKLWGSPIQDSSEEFLIRKEELREFICMLVFIESNTLITQGVTVRSMYRIAHNFNVPLLHEACKKCIINEVSTAVSDILTFSRFYDDKELERVAISYIEENSLDTQDPNLDFEFVDIMTYFDVSDTRHVKSNLIQSAYDFWQYLEDILEEINCTVEVGILRRVSSVKRKRTETEPESFDFYR